MTLRPCRPTAKDKTVTIRSQVAALAVAAGTVIGFVAPTSPGLAWAVASQPAAPAVGRQLAELAGSGTVALDWFGASVAVSGSTVVVGASQAPLLSSGVGRAYVFTRTATGWHESAELESPDTVGPDWFGDSVAVSGSTIVVGAPAISVLSSGLGRTYVFTKTATGWHESAELEGPGTLAGDGFGDSVAVSGSTVVVGAPSHASKAGAAYVFRNSAKGWQATELKGSDTGAKDDFGDSVAVSGSTIVVGAFGHASEAGRAYVFTKTPTGWHQAAELSGSGTVAGDGFGVSVAVAGRIIAVGAGLAASAAGRVYLFTKKATGWHQSAQLHDSDTLDKDDFGDSVAVSGHTVVVGTFARASSAGRAYLFTSTPTGWHQTAELAGSSTVSGNEFGYSVAISGSTVVVGAEGQESGAGRAYVFEA
jgi:FG-GAP repeat